MTLLTCAALAILFSLSNKEILASTQNTLKKQLHESLKDIDPDCLSERLDNTVLNLLRLQFLLLLSIILHKSITAASPFPGNRCGQSTANHSTGKS